MNTTLWTQLLIVLAIGSVWIGSLTVLRQLIRRKLLEFRVKREAKHIAEAFAVDPSRLEQFLELYYGDAYNRDCGVIHLEHLRTPKQNGTIRFRLDLVPDEADSNRRLRIVPLGLKSLRRFVFEPTDAARGWVNVLSVKGPNHYL